MSLPQIEILSALQYAAPPAVGAFIGYLTNKIAIKMLFRPLKPWYFLGLKVPMTPGVIPSKRGVLADNMGRMVSEHLLTSTEIGKALDQKEIKDQILKTIEAEGEIFAAKDLGSLKSLIPEQFTCYYDLGVQYISYKSTQGFKEYINSDTFEHVLEEQISSIAGHFLNSNVSHYISAEKQQHLFEKIEKSLSEKIEGFLDSPEFKSIIHAFVQDKIYQIVSQQKSLDDLLSETNKELIRDIIKNQSQPLLSGVSQLVKDEKIKQQIIDGACKGVENFINSMGPMAAMVQNFVKIETVREKIEEYLVEKEEDIINWVQSDEMVEKLNAILEQQTNNLFSTPLSELCQKIEPEKFEDISLSLSNYLCSQLKDERLTNQLSQSLVIQIKDYFSADPSVGSAFSKIIGPETIKDIVDSINRQCLTLLRSDKTEHILQPAIDTLIKNFTNKKIGPLENILNQNMRQSIYSSLQKTTLTVLKKEIPEVTQALNLQKIVSTKINSLDLLKLEGLLLSIMEEQFKYINLFGALLGFILGLINLFFIFLN